MAESFWTEERVATLREMWVEEAAPTADIASFLNCTRNMVIGKANRLHLCKRSPADFARRVMSKLSWPAVRKIRQAPRVWNVIPRLANKFGVSENAIHAARYRKTWVRALRASRPRRPRSIVRFPIEKCSSPSEQYYCSRHRDCCGPRLPSDHATFCDLGENCDVHWEPCEFCAPVETLDRLFHAIGDELTGMLAQIRRGAP